MITPGFERPIWSHATIRGRGCRSRHNTASEQWVTPWDAELDLLRALNW